MMNEAGKIRCSLLMGKSRVSQLKPVTIPRLELTASTVSVKVTNLLKKEIEMKSLGEYFLADSQVVLGYIKNETKKFHVYVANQIQTIRNQSDVE